MKPSQKEECHVCGKIRILKRVTIMYSHFHKKYTKSGRSFRMSHWLFVCEKCLVEKVNQFLTVKWK